MKNIEKYPNTKVALEAYNQLKSKNVPFDKWLECEFEEHREPTLLEAAQELKNTLSQKDITLHDVAVALSSLTAAIKREKRKPVRNCDKYKTADEASKAFTLMCEKMSCHHCPYNQGRALNCKFAWLYEEIGKEKSK